MMLFASLLSLLVTTLLATAAPAQVSPSVAAATAITDVAWYPQSIESRQPPFHEGGAYTRLDYVPLPGAAERWKICASVPPTSFEYFRAIAGGLEAEAARQGVGITVHTLDDFDVEAQAVQLETCLEEQADAVILAPVGPEGFGPALARARTVGMPVIQAVTSMHNDDVTARVVTDRVAVGRAAGRFLADRHPAGADIAEVIWLYGPPNTDVSADVDLGFRAGIANGAIEIVHAAAIPLDEESIRRNVRAVLAGDAEFVALVGGARTIRVAVAELSETLPPGAIELVSVTVASSVVAGIEAGRVFAGINDKAVAQARIAVDLAIRAIEGRPLMRDLRPTLETVDRSNVADFDRRTILLDVE